jgi:hypothetical protein
MFPCIFWESQFSNRGASASKKSALDNPQNSNPCWDAKDFIVSEMFLGVLRMRHKFTNANQIMPNCHKIVFGV